MPKTVLFHLSGDGGGGEVVLTGSQVKKDMAVQIGGDLPDPALAGRQVPVIAQALQRTLAHLQGGGSFPLRRPLLGIHRRSKR